MEQPIVFQNLGIARVRVKDIRESLITREKLQIDPFNQGYDFKPCKPCEKIVLQKIENFL